MPTKVPFGEHVKINVKVNGKICENVTFEGQNNLEQDSIPVGCVPLACQPYMFQWPVLDVSTKVEVCPQVNKFEQISSDAYQMSVAGEGVGLMSPVTNTRC